MYKIPKFDEASRNFETRVKFIHDIFANKYSPNQIMANCIQHKLDKSYEAYVKKIHKSYWTLHNEDPMKILKRIDK